MDILEYIKNNSTEEIIENVKNRNKKRFKRKYIREIYVRSYKNGKIIDFLKLCFDRMQREKVSEYFEWTQCEDPDYNKFYEKLIIDVKKNIDSYKKAYRILSDDISKEVFKDILKWKVTLESQYLVKAFYKSNSKQYFEPFEYLTNEEIFVDCGGYIGDSTQGLIDYRGGLKKVYLYEADSQNIERAKEILKNINIIFRNVGVGDMHKFMFFSQNGLSSSSFTEIQNGGNKVEIVTLDDDINEAVTFIKMDIEGFEYKALQGAKNHIINDRPCLAICLYHKPEDLWQLPLYINDLVGSYNYYIRHYTMFHGETVLYAVPKERKH